MKTSLHLAIGLLTASALITSCTESTGIVEQTQLQHEANSNIASPKTRAAKTDNLTFEEVKTYLEQCGYDTSTLTEHEDYYLIDSDMGFSKEGLAEAINQPSTRMASSKQLSKEYYRLNLNLNYTDNESLNAFIEAVDEWNSIADCSIDFSSTFHNNNRISRPQIRVDISENPIIGGATKLYELLLIKMPENGKPGSILINTNHANWKNIPYIQKVYVIMHALGHLVGCDHYNFNSKDYPGTQHDPNTIMQNESGLTNNNWLWQGFTAKDIQALQTMYKLEPATHKITCQPEIIGSDKTKMVVGTEYTLTASYEYDWLLNPTYSYEVIAAQDVVTYSVKNNTLKLKFLKGGSCTVRVRATDAYGEKKPDGSDYAFEVDYYAYPDKPTFTYPSSIDLNTFYTFRMALNNPDYKNVSYKYTVGEEFFDNNTDRSVDIEHDGKGTARIRFNDYGKYTVTAEAFYEGKSSKFIFGFTKLYRPDYTIGEENVPGVQSYGNIDLPKYSTTPTGDNLISMTRVLVKFGTNPLMTDRVACEVQDDIRQQIWIAPYRIDYRILEIRSRNLVTLNKGDSSFVRLPPGRTYWHPDMVNYVDHATLIYPYAWVFYTEDDRCGLLGKQ